MTIKSTVSEKPAEKSAIEPAPRTVPTEAHPKTPDTIQTAELASHEAKEPVPITIPLDLRDHAIREILQTEVKDTPVHTSELTAKPRIRAKLSRVATTKPAIAPKKPAHAHKETAVVLGAEVPKLEVTLEDAAKYEPEIEAVPETEAEQAVESFEALASAETDDDFVEYTEEVTEDVVVTTEDALHELPKLAEQSFDLPDRPVEESELVARQELQTTVATKLELLKPAEAHEAVQILDEITKKIAAITELLSVDLETAAETKIPEQIAELTELCKNLLELLELPATEEDIKRMLAILLPAEVLESLQNPELEVCPHDEGTHEIKLDFAQSLTDLAHRVYNDLNTLTHLGKFALKSRLDAA